MKRTAWSTGVVVLCLAVPAMASAQSPAPPKQIIEVKTRELCTTLRESIAPTLVGLIKNYQAIDASRNAVAAAAADANDPHSQMARLYIENTVSAIVHNLAVIDHFLADTKHFPLDPTNDDERAAAKVKARLAAVEANQRMLLNGIYATAETAGMADMGHVFPVGTVVEGPRSEVMAHPDVTNAGLDKNSPTTIDPHLTATAGLTTLTTGSFDRETLENNAAASVMRVVAQCRGGSPTPPAP